jgi:tetratricopeptide (TPR) repeat protein
MRGVSAEPQSAVDVPPEPGRAGDVVPPGMLTALLKEMVSSPEEAAGTGWKDWAKVGAVVGRFELLREIGRGGFGTVWEARDRELGRSVAFKAVRAGTRASVREERLLAEAEAAAHLSHPNLVTLHDVGRTDQGPYLVYELLHGETLERRLHREPMSVREAVATALAIAKGVAHAHERGVFHRDLKPANVMVCSDGQVKVLDFGLAHAFGWHYEAGGTPAYMAPEQEVGGPEDERADVFALGAMLYRMVAGKVPYPVDGKGRRDLERRPAPLRAPDAPGLAELVARMLEREPALRPRDGAEVRAGLEAIQRQLDEAARPARRWTPWRVIAGVLVGVLLGTGVALFAPRRAERLVASDGRPMVAVADFVNETGDPDLDALSGLLITSLEQSQRFRVLTRARMIDLLRELGHGDATRLDESLARAVGRKAGIQDLLLVSVRKLGDAYAADLRAIDPRKGEALFTLSEQAASKGDLFALIDRLSDRARLALHESDADVRASEVSVADAVTPDLEAYGHYFQGMDLAGRGHVNEAVEEFARAAADAPGFALAQVEVAWLGYLSGARSHAVARDLMREASRNAARAPAKEAGMIRILSAFLDARFAAAREEIRSLAARYPEDRDVAVMAAEVLAWCGEVEGALPYFERALRLASDWDFLRIDQVELLFSVGRGEEARSLAEAGVRKRGTPPARVAAGVARYLAGDVAGGIEAMRAAGDEFPVARGFLAIGLAAQGKTDEAHAVLAAAADEVLAHIFRAMVFASAGRLREGVDQLDAAARLTPDAPFMHQVTAAYLAAAGDLDAARTQEAQGDFFIAQVDGVALTALGDEGRLAALRAEVGPETLFQGRFLRALAALEKGDPASALGELRDLDRGGASFVSYFRGLAAGRLGLDQEAVDALRRFDGPVFSGSNAYMAPWLLARARYLRARSLLRLGQPGEARALVDLQLERWKDADPDLPLLAELKALRAELGPARTPASR